MPAGLVKGKDGERAWEKAKSIVRKQYPALSENGKGKDRFWALVTTVYKSVCKSPDYACEGMSGLLDRLDGKGRKKREADYMSPHQVATLRQGSGPST